jgi:tetratricopeptide (TPR) repeat protein
VSVLEAQATGIPCITSNVVPESIIIEGLSERIETYDVDAYSCQGNYKTALKWYKKALAVQEKVLGSDHPDMATTYNNIASIYNSQGDYPTALEWYKKVLAIREKVLGPEHTDMGILYNSIGYIYGCQSEYKTALAWLEKALAVFEKVLGSDHPDTVTVYNNITMVNKMIKSQHNDSK